MLLIIAASSGVWLLAAIFSNIFLDTPVFRLYGDTLLGNVWAIILFPIEDALQRDSALTTALKYFAYGASQIPTVLFYLSLMMMYLGVLVARASRGMVRYYVRITVEEAKRPEEIAVGKRTGIALSLTLLPLVITLALLRNVGAI